eukprot:jgi/Picre1/27980/NNA_000941.t1
MIEDVEDAGDVVPLPNVKLISWKRGEGFANEEKQDLDKWNKDFTRVDQQTLFELILAANYLNIKPLLDLTCMTVANMIKGKTPEEIRKTFNIEMTLPRRRRKRSVERTSGLLSRSSSCGYDCISSFFFPLFSARDVGTFTFIIITTTKAMAS